MSGEWQLSLEEGPQTSSDCYHSEGHSGHPEMALSLSLCELRDDN